MSELYILPEYMHLFEDCGSCMCAMCFHWFQGCRACPFCFYLGGAACVKFCDDFIPAMLPWQLREWFDQDKVIVDPNSDVDNFPFK